jgi:hypothetical protein
VKGQDGGALASSRAAFKEMRENNLCMAIAQDIQRLEVGAADTVGTVDAVQHISFCPRCFAPMLQNDRHGHPKGGAPITATNAHMQMVDTPCPVFSFRQQQHIACGSSAVCTMCAEFPNHVSVSSSVYRRNSS